MTDWPTPVPASSVVALRADPELRVLMVKRAQSSRSWAGRWVFPGGRIEEDESPREAAIRELFEESGVLLTGASVEVAPAPGASVEKLAEMRRSLNAGELSFDDLLTEIGASVDPERMVPLARWITPSLEPRRFDAHFFICDVSDLGSDRLDQVEADALETSAAEWAVPASILEAYARRELDLVPPTLRILEELRTWGSPGASVERARARPDAAIMPRVVPDLEPIRILLPWDREYAGTPGDGVDWDRDLGEEHFGPSRFVLRDGGWRSESG